MVIGKGNRIKTIGRINEGLKRLHKINAKEQFANTKNIISVLCNIRTLVLIPLDIKLHKDENNNFDGYMF